MIPILSESSVKIKEILHIVANITYNILHLIVIPWARVVHLIYTPLALKPQKFTTLK